jgi:hypothetical protein
MVFILASLLSVLVLVGCGDKPQKAGGVKLLETTTTVDGKMKYEYDAQNRVVKMVSYYYDVISAWQTVTYSRDGSIKVARVFVSGSEDETNFVRNGNTITVYAGDMLSETITLDNDGNIAKIERPVDVTEYHYQDGNLIKREKNFILSAQSAVGRFKYDDKKTPFYNCKTPKWFLQLFFFDGGHNNNIVERKYYYHDESTVTYIYEFEYDSDGFPVKQTSDAFGEDIGGFMGETIYFTYRGATEIILTETEIKTKTETNGDEIIHDPEFDIYGTWEYVVSPSSHHEWKATPPKITINADNTVTAQLLGSHYRGVLNKIDSYEFRFHINYFRLGDFENDGDGTEWTFIYDPATNLLKWGDSDFRKISDNDLTSGGEALELHHVVGWYPVEINMHVFYSALSDGRYSLDSLVFRYGGVMQTVHLHSFESLKGRLNFDPDDFYLIRVGDYNFDGYMDIVILTTNLPHSRHEFFLFNPQTNSFDYSVKLSELYGVEVDDQTKTITSSEDGGDQGRIYSNSQYKWIDGQLTLIHSESQGYGDDSERYIRTTRTLQNGEWVQQADTISVEDL